VIRVILPTHLRTLARVDGPVELPVPEPATQRALLDALEAAFPALRGTIRDASTKRRRAFIRFYVSDQDLSDVLPDAPLPPEVVAGQQPYRIIGAMAGG